MMIITITIIMLILKVMDCNAILITVQITRCINVSNENFTNPYAFGFAECA